MIHNAFKSTEKNLSSARVQLYKHICKAFLLGVADMKFFNLDPDQEETFWYLVIAFRS